MDLNKLPLFAMMTKRMAWLSQRQQVLAHNIANADTPGFRPRDLKEPSFKDAMAGTRPSLALAVSDAAHLPGGAGRGAGTGAAKERVDREVYETSPSGNAVVIEQQLLKASETAMNYRMITNLYRKQIGLLKTAIGRGGPGQG